MASAGWAKNGGGVGTTGCPAAKGEEEVCEGTTRSRHQVARLAGVARPQLPPGSASQGES